MANTLKRQRWCWGWGNGGLRSEWDELLREPNKLSSSPLGGATTRSSSDSGRLKWRAEVIPADGEPGCQSTGTRPKFIIYFVQY